MKTYTVTYLYQNEEQYFIYNSDSGAFPDSEEMMHLALADALERHDSTKPKTNVEIISVVLVR